MSTNMRALGGGDIEAGTFNAHASDIEGKILPIEARVEEMANRGPTNLNDDDIEKYASSLESMLEDVPKYMCNPGHPGKISRIPHNLLEVDMKSYEPCFLSIGPYHHGKISLEHMEKKKWVVLKCFLEQNPKFTLKYLLSEIKSMEPAVRSFYTDIEMGSDTFVQMLLLDSLYLVIFFSGMTKCQENVNHSNREFWSDMDSEETNKRVNQTNQAMDTADDCERTHLLEMEYQSNDENMIADNKTNVPRWYWTMLVHDLFLLENQLPFFVLQKICDLVYGGSETQLLRTITSMFDSLLFDYVKPNSEILLPPSEGVHHLLHLCHIFLSPTVKQEFTTLQLLEPTQLFRFGSAVQLYEAGVNFEANWRSTQFSLLDVTFSSSGKMVMPSLHVDDNTNSLLRNLIALEQMKYPSLGLNVSAYAVFLLHLITVPGDVQLLRRKGIIQHLWQVTRRWYILSTVLVWAWLSIIRKITTA